MAFERTGPITKDTSTVALGLARILVGKFADYVDQKDQTLNKQVDSLGALNSTSFTSNVDYWKLVSGFPQLEDMTIPLSETAQLECEFKEVHPRNLAIARGIDPGNPAIDSAAYEVAVNTAAGNTPDISTITTDNNGGVIDEEYMVVVESVAPLTVAVYGKNTGEITTGHNLSASTGSVLEPDNSGYPYFSIPTGFLDTNWAEGETYVFATTAFIPEDTQFADNHSGEIPLGTVKQPDFVRMEAIYTYPNKTNHMYIIFPRAQVTSSVSLDFAAEDNANVPITIEAKRADDGVVGGHVTWNESPLGRIYFD